MLSHLPALDNKGRLCPALLIFILYAPSVVITLMHIQNGEPKNFAAGNAQIHADPEQKNSKQK